MNRTHKLVILKNNADEIFEGNKTFEIRRNDRSFQEGDVVVFKAFEHPEHPINSIEYEISCVVTESCAEGCGLRNDYVALGLKRLS